MKNLTIEQLNEAITAIRDLSEMEPTEKMPIYEIIEKMNEELEFIEYTFIVLDKEKKIIEVFGSDDTIGFCFTNEKAYKAAHHFIFNNKNLISIPYVGRLIDENHYIIKNSEIPELEKIFDTTFM